MKTLIAYLITGEELQGILNHEDSKHRWVFRSFGTITEVEISNGCPLFHIEEYKD